MRSLALLLAAAFAPVLRAQEQFVMTAPDSIEVAMTSPDTLTVTSENDTLTVALAETDSIAAALSKRLRSNGMGLTLKRDLSTFKPEPMRAMWLGLVMPGGGQIYNRKYWKLPIVYGGFLGCVYALSWNSMMLKDYSQAYLDIMDSDPETKSYEKMLPMNYSIVGKEERFKEIFKNKKNYFRKYRDMSIFAFGAVYLLSVIDAYVDAELSGFDISHDLSFHLQPTFLETERTGMHHRSTTPGLQCVLTF